MLLTLIAFIFILSVLVIIHEAGHFFTAKFFGIKVEEFGFGFPPRVFGIKRGETIYSINWLPIGGFVKLYGEDEAGGGKITLPNKTDHKATQEELKRAFYARPAWQRALVILNGVIMNTVLAIVIYYIFLSLSSFKTELPLLDPNFNFVGANQTVNSQILVSEVVPNSPASKAGITVGTALIAIDGKKISDYTNVAKIIDSHKGEKVTLTLQNPSTLVKRNVTVIPRINPPKNQGAIGIAFFPMQSMLLTYTTISQKIFSGITYPYNMLVYNFDVIGKLIAVSVKQHTLAPISQSVSGPVGIYSVVGTVVHIPNLKERILDILNLMGLLSISLAFFNILPIPALDGGRFFFILFELVFRRKVNPVIEGYIHTAGMALLLILLLLVTVSDLGKLFH